MHELARRRMCWMRVESHTVYELYYIDYKQVIESKDSSLFFARVMDEETNSKRHNHN